MCVNKQPGMQDYTSGLEQIQIPHRNKQKREKKRKRKEKKIKHIDFHRDVSRYAVSLAVSEGGVSHFLPMRLSGGERLSGKYNRGV